MGANDRLIEMIALQPSRHSSWTEYDSVAEGFVKHMNNCAFSGQKMSWKRRKNATYSPNLQPQIQIQTNAYEVLG